jgi:hypothetical protein
MHFHPQLRMLSERVHHPSSQPAGADDQRMALIVSVPTQEPKRLPEQHPRKAQGDEVQQPEIEEHQSGIFVLPEEKGQCHQNQHGEGIGFRHVEKLRQPRAHPSRAVEVEGLERHAPDCDDRHQQQQIDPERRNALGGRFHDL